MEKRDQLTLTSKMLAECKTPANIVDLPAVADRWVNTYELTTGKKDGQLRFEAEKVLFLQTIAESTELAKCTPMSIYSSFILLAVSGLSLRDGQSYLIPFKGKAVWMPGWKGRLEQIEQIPGVNHVTEPICVFENESDDFEYEIEDEEYKILRHKPALNTEGQKILAVYASIKYQNGDKRTFLMKREAVLSIRDRYSKSYSDYMKIVPNAEGKRIKKYRDKQTGEWKEFEIEAPMWITDEEQAFKKTLIKRIYNSIAKEKGGVNAYVDDQIREAIGSADADQMDADDISSKIDDIAGVEDTTYEEVDAPAEAEDHVEAEEATDQPQQLFNDAIPEDDDSF